MYSITDWLRWVKSGDIRYHLRGTLGYSAVIPRDPICFRLLCNRLQASARSQSGFSSSAFPKRLRHAACHVQSCTTWSDQTCTTCPSIGGTLPHGLCALSDRVCPLRFSPPLSQPSPLHAPRARRSKNFPNATHRSTKGAPGPSPHHTPRLELFAPQAVPRVALARTASYISTSPLHSISSSRSSQQVDARTTICDARPHDKPRTRRA